MDKCFVITTYCDTPKKINELKKCINNIKQYNIDILIHAHYPLDADIQKLANYYIYDYSNPVITNGSKSINRWKWYVTANKLLSLGNPDYSYAVMSQWTSSIKMLKEKGYKELHIINFDIFIKPKIFNKHQEFLQTHDIVFEYPNNKDLVYVAFLSIKNTFFDEFMSNLTLEKYLASRDTMLETYMLEVIEKNDNFKIKKTRSNIAIQNNPNNKEDYEIYATIEYIDHFDLLKHKNLCWVFGGHNKEYDKFEILFFEILNPINEIIININGENIIEKNITEKYYSYVSTYSMEEINKIIDNKKLSVTINGELIDNYKYQSIKKQSISPKFK